MNKPTEALVAIVLVVVLVAICEFVRRLRWRHRVEYNDYVLRRRDNVPMGDLDVDSGDGI
jgi:membrane protein YdbS with pleckstrin-like domain